MRFLLLFCAWKLCAATSDDWERTEYAWIFGLRNFCDVGVNGTPETFYKDYRYGFNPSLYTDIKKNDLIWIQTPELKDFYHQIFPTLKSPVILLACMGDASFPSESGLTPDQIEDLFASPYILHAFAQNCDYQGPSNKISPIPIGFNLQFSLYSEEPIDEPSPKQQEQELKKIQKRLRPTHQRFKRAFVDFQHHDTMQHLRYKQFGDTRTTIFEKIKKTGLIDYHNNRVSRSALWKTKAKYAFSISPWGNGLDCFRTWEDLALGCIVIVKTSPIDRLYEGLPVVIIQDWDEITEENMTIWLEKYKDAFTNPSYRERLTNQYWLNKILSKKAP